MDASPGFYNGYVKSDFGRSPRSRSVSRHPLSSFEVFETRSFKNISDALSPYVQFSSDTSENSKDSKTDASIDDAMKRQPREVFRMPTPPPIIKRIVERVPTPEAYVIERVIVRPAAQRIVERIIERPRTPPPRIVHKEVTEPPPPPIVRTRVIKIESWPRAHPMYYVNNANNNSPLPLNQPCTASSSFEYYNGCPSSFGSTSYESCRLNMCEQMFPNFPIMHYNTTPMNAFPFGVSNNFVSYNHFPVPGFVYGYQPNRFGMQQTVY